MGCVFALNVGRILSCLSSWVYVVQQELIAAVNVVQILLRFWDIPSHSPTSRVFLDQLIFSIHQKRLSLHCAIMTLCVSPVEPQAGSDYLSSISGNRSSTSLLSQHSSYVSSRNEVSSQDDMGNAGITAMKPKTKVSNGVTVVEEALPSKSTDTIEPELCKITPNSIYLTFNAPNVDEYVSTSTLVFDLD